MLLQRVQDGSISSALKLLCYRDQTLTLKHYCKIENQLHMLV